MTLETKILNPITLKIGDKENVVIIGEESFSLDNGIMLGSEHYGFNLVSSYKGNENITVYETQCKIVGAQIVDNNINVYEDNKYVPWRFNKTTGALVNSAVFSDAKISEMEYVRATYGINSEEELNELNNYVKNKQ